MSATMARARENKPPAPRPWKARNAASMYMDWATPHRAEPITNSVMASMKNCLRP